MLSGNVSEDSNTEIPKRTCLVCIRDIVPQERTRAVEDLRYTLSAVLHINWFLSKHINYGQARRSIQMSMRR